MIYLDHAATMPLREEVFAQMLPFMRGFHANASAVYAAARESRKAIDAARTRAAEAIGARDHEIYFTSGGTEADNWALFGAALSCPEKKHIVTTQIEHHAVLHACQALERHGYEITFLQPDEQARISPQAAASAIREDTLIVSVMLANNEVGTIEPVKEIANLAHERGALVHTDAVQAIGHIPVNVSELNVDLLSMSAHKFGGPKGIGALFARTGTKIGNLMYGGAQERGMRPGTENTPAIVGMGAAIALACEEMPQDAVRTAYMRDSMQSALEQIPGVVVHAASANRLPGHLHISVADMNAQLLLMRMDMAGVACSAGSACTSGATERSHVIRAMGLVHENEADIRFSIGRENTMEECMAAVDALRRILKR